MKEGAHESGFISDSLDGMTQGCRQFGEAVRCKVGERHLFEMPPDPFIGI